MTIVRVGTSEKYADGWARAFGKTAKGNKSKGASSAKKGSPKKRTSSRKKAKK